MNFFQDQKIIQQNIIAVKMSRCTVLMLYSDLTSMPSRSKNKYFLHYGMPTSSSSVLMYDDHKPTNHQRDIIVDIGTDLISCNDIAEN